jgi:hypothetical protein
MSEPEVPLPTVPAVLVPVLSPVSPQGLATTPTGMSEATSRRTPRRRWGVRWRSLAVLGLLVAAAGIGTYFYTRHLSSSASLQTARVTDRKSVV